MIIGVDEAGVGSVFGSMFVTSVKGKNNLDILSRVDDSKKISNSKIEKIYDETINNKKIEIETIEVKPEEIDCNNMSSLIIKKHAECIERLVETEDKIYCDSPKENEKEYEREIKNLLKKQVNITGRNKADEKYKIVSLASIIAKASREKHITEKRQKYGRDIGSGYPGDRKTRKFLERYYSKNGKLPEETRLKWSTSQEIIDEFAQSSINDF